TCHSPHGSNLGGMITQSQTDLCYSCHSDVRGQIEAGKSTHAPVTGGECTKCHNP
ncbi:MAG: cytochrome C, partial [Armatimonadetes bacterium]|nr:cytochrome C [Armatimonadota bacterium]NIO95674.1 cytochrome C [Armatimonadota bacterium]